MMLYETKLPTSKQLLEHLKTATFANALSNKTSQISILKNWRTLFGTVGFSSVRQITFKCIVIFYFVKQQGFSDTSVVNGLLRLA